MNVFVNKDILSGKWKQARGLLKQGWGKLTDNDLESINGRTDMLIGRLQERYGHTRAQAEQAVAKFLEKLSGK